MLKLLFALTCERVKLCITRGTKKRRRRKKAKQTMPVLPFWQCHPNSPRQSETQFITMAGPSNPLKAALVLLIHCLLGIVFVNFRQAAVIPPPAHNLIAPLISLLIPALPLSACSSFNLGHNLFVCVFGGSVISRSL